MDESQKMVSALKDAVACAVTMRGPHTIEERAALVDQTTAAVLAAMRKGGVPEGEQKAFETWARERGLCLDMHPLHYLFLDADTNLARQAWKAATLSAARAEIEGKRAAGVALLPNEKKAVLTNSEPQNSQR